MIHFIFIVFLSVSLHAAGPVRIGFDAKVVEWNERCMTNNPNKFIFGQALNSTISLLASSIWMGGIRNAGLYPGNILRANLMCGGSYGGSNGCGDCLTVGCYNIGSPQIPLINDSGGGMDICLNVSPVNSLQGYWKYKETGTGAGLGCISTTNYVVFDTGLAPSSVSSWLNDVHVCAYMMGGPVEAAEIIGAYQQSTPDALQLTTVYTGFGQASSLWSSANVISSADTNGTGFYICTRINGTSTGSSQYHNRILTGTSTVAAGTPVNITVPIYIWAINQTTPEVAAMSSHLSGGYAIGRGIIASTITNNYYNTWQQFETLLARQK